MLNVVKGNHHTLPTSTSFRIASPSFLHITRLKVSHWRFCDEDLGISGSGIDKRSGFARLTSEVALAHVGIVLGLEVSRLARNNADWYRLLELCGLTDTLIGDNDGVYHPALFNDRLLLGLNRPDTQSTSYSTSGRIDASGLSFGLATERGLRLVSPSRLQI